MKVFQQSPLLVLLLLMAVVPIPKAGMMMWALPAILFCGWLFFITTVFVELLRESDHPNNRMQSNIKWLLPWLVVTVWMILQLFVFPHWLEWKPLFFKEDISGTFFEDFNAPIDLISSLEWWGLFCVYWSIAWGGSKFSFKQIVTIMQLVTVVSFLMAVLALYLHFSGQKIILGLWEKDAYIGDATGSFVNRNHLANFLALCLPVSLNYLLSIANFTSSRLKVFFVASAFIYLIVVIATIVATHSRMGFVSAILAFLVWILLSKKKSIKFNRKVSVSIQLVLLVGAIVWFFWFGFNELLERFLDSEIGLARQEFREIMYTFPLTVWLLGVQPGAFADVLMAQAPASFNGRLTHAHSDYLQFIFEFGIIGSLLLLFSGLKLLRSINFRSRNAVLAGVIGAVVAMLGHSFVDFSLHVPANAIYFWVFIGILANKSPLPEKYLIAECSEGAISKQLMSKNAPKPLKNKVNLSSQEKEQ